MFLLYVLIVSNIKLCTSVSVDMFSFILCVPKSIMLAFMYRWVYTIHVCIYVYIHVCSYGYTHVGACVCVLCVEARD